MKDVEILKKKDIESYKTFINEIFGYEIEDALVNKLLKNNTIYIIKVDDRVVASVTIEERFEYIKNQKYYHLGYLGVLKEYRREGYASKLFDKVEELVKENNIKYVELTSGNQRRSAQYFCKNKKFKIKDSTIFIKIY